MSSYYEDTATGAMIPLAEPEVERPVSLCEALDRMLNKGVVVAGEVVISVADVDLIYLNLQVLLTSVETAYRQQRTPARAVLASTHDS